MYETILVPITDSLGSRHNARRASELAACFDSTVHLLYVVPASGYRFDAETALSLDEAEKLVDELIEELFGERSAAVEGTVRRGKRRKVTRNYLDEIDPDLLISGQPDATQHEYLSWKQLRRLLEESSVSVLLAQSNSDDPDR